MPSYSNSYEDVSFELDGELNASIRYSMDIYDDFTIIKGGLYINGGESYVSLRYFLND